MSISARPAFTSTSLILFLVILVASNGCDKIGKGLTKVVLVEYDQPLNFTEYEFEQYLHTSDPVASEWKKIRLHDRTEKRKGVWMVYLICSIKNEASKAEQFNYDAAKFFVDYGGRKHFYKPLQAGTYESTYPAQGAQGSDVTTAVLAPMFRTETQLGPDTESIPPNQSRSNYRLVIYVSTEAGDQTDLTNLKQRLYYNDTPVDLIDRHNDTSAATGIIKGASLPTQCRPPKK